MKAPLREEDRKCGDDSKAQKREQNVDELKKEALCQYQIQERLGEKVGQQLRKKITNGGQQEQKQMKPRLENKVLSKASRGIEHHDQHQEQ